MKIKIEVLGEKDVMRGITTMGNDIIRDVQAETYASGLEVQAEAIARLKSFGAWDTGHCARSIIVERSPDGMITEVGPTAPYGVYVEEGTRPCFPPPHALERWAKKHGFKSAWPICRAIAKRGLPARPYLFPAWLAISRKFFQRIRRIIER